MSTRVAVVLAVGMIASSLIASAAPHWVWSNRLERRLEQVETSLEQNEKGLGQIEKRLAQLDKVVSERRDKAPQLQGEPVPPDRELAPKSVAVLPFVFVSSGKGDADSVTSYLATALVNALAVQPKLKVVPLSSVPAQPSAKAPPLHWSDPRQAGRKLGASYVVAGRASLLEGGFVSRLNVHVELIRVETGFLVLSKDVELQSLLVDGKFQQEVAKFAGAVAPQVGAKVAE